MKLLVNLSLIYFFINLDLIDIVGSSQSFIFEALQSRQQKSNNFLQNFRRSMFRNKEEYPEPLPKTTISPEFLRGPHQSIYQGFRRPNDTRVFRRRFEYEAQKSGQHVYVKGNFDCILTHLAIETIGGIPILLRGGAGYRYFVAVARARPDNELRGSVRAYCLKNQDEYYRSKETPPPSKYFI